MRKELKRAVRSRFNTRILEVIPGIARDTRQRLFEEYWLYSWKPVPVITAYVCLVLSNKEEKFTVELGWSADGIYHSGPTTVDPHAQAANISFRLSRLWKPAGDAKWWELARRLPENSWLTMSPDEEVKRLLSDDYVKEGMANVEPMVDEAIALIRRYALPYFDQIKRNGSEVERPIMKP